jgi:hypothetical protein
MGQHASGFYTVRVLSRIEQILIGKFENIPDPFSYPLNGNETPNIMGVPID